MTKKIIVDSAGTPASSAKQIVDVKPSGSSLLVEMLNNDELLGTNLYVGEKTDVGCPQGYVRAFGPKLTAADAGFEVGSRVVLQGSYVPVPNVQGGSNRKKGIVELHNIKAVLVEE
jgi:hypothetical protein